MFDSLKKKKKLILKDIVSQISAYNKYILMYLISQSLHPKLVKSKFQLNLILALYKH